MFWGELEEIIKRPTHSSIMERYNILFNQTPQQQFLPVPLRFNWKEANMINQEMLSEGAIEQKKSHYNTIPEQFVSPRVHLKLEGLSLLKDPKTIIFAK